MTLTHAQQELQQRARALARETIAPNAAEVDRSEQYPWHNVKALQEELTSTENKVAFARQAYNDSVMSYNNTREVFPNSIVAGMFNFAPAAPLDIAKPEAREAPKVSFS